MSFAFIQRFTKIAPYAVAALLLLSILAISGTTKNDNVSTKNSFGSVPLKVQSEQTSNLDNSTQDQNTAGETSDADNNNENNSSGSNSSKVHFSLSTQTTNGETTGSANVSVTNNGNTLDFSDSLEKCFSDGDIRVRTDNTKIDCESEDGKFEVDWKSDFDQDEDNEVSIKSDIDQKQKSN